MGKRLSPHIWKQIQEEFEHGEADTIAALCRKWKINRTTLNTHRKNEDWLPWGTYSPRTEPVEPAAPPLPDVDIEGIASSAADRAAEKARLEAANLMADKVVEQEARIAELEAKLVEASKAAAGVKFVPDFTSAEQLMTALKEAGDDTLQEAALAALGHVNLDRMSRGLPHIDFVTEDPGRLEQEMRKIAEELVARKTKWRRGDVRLRNLKMVKPDGTLVQVPIERQINNEAAQPGTSLWKKREMGYLIMDPHRCQRLDCWLVAQHDEQGRLTLDGYCSMECRSTDPYLNQRVIEGVSVSGQRENRSVLIGGNISI